MLSLLFKCFGCVSRTYSSRDAKWADEHVSMFGSTPNVTRVKRGLSTVADELIKRKSDTVI